LFRQAACVHPVWLSRWLYLTCIFNHIDIHQEQILLKTGDFVHFFFLFNILLTRITAGMPIRKNTPVSIMFSFEKMARPDLVPLYKLPITNIMDAHDKMNMFINFRNIIAAQLRGTSYSVDQYTFQLSVNKISQ